MRLSSTMRTGGRSNASRSQLHLVSSLLGTMGLLYACSTTVPPAPPASDDGGSGIGPSHDAGTANDASHAADGGATDASVKQGGEAGLTDAGQVVTPLDSGGDAAAKGDPYILAPPSRTVTPVAVLSTSGTVNNPNNVLSGQATTLSGAGAQIVLDFGKEVGGILSISFASSSGAQTVGVAFSESSLYVGPNSDNSNGSSSTSDGALSVAVGGASSWTSDPMYLRGGFRYATIVLTSSGSVDINGVSLAFSPDPERAIPNQYPNYFYSNDDLLNRAWYSGAYTAQMDTVGNNQGRVPPAPSANWDNTGAVGEIGTTVIVDGAKRDRTVWPGDMGISLATGYVSLGETDAAKNALYTLYNHQQSSGELDWSGPPWNLTNPSDTYHMWTLHGTYLAYLYSGDKAWLDSVWARYQLGVTYITGKVDANGLLSVTGNADWGPRQDMGGENVEANSLLYEVLTGAATLATVEGDTASATSYTSLATSLRANINAALWDTSVGAFLDQPGVTLHPQDGNALAVWFGVIDDPAKARGLSYVHNEWWNALGSVTPEWGQISTFVGSMELMSHFASGYDTRGLDLIRLTWGFMLSDPNGPQSTFWESMTTTGTYDSNGDGPAPSASFTSLCHGWATGPTSALTFYVLGVAPDTVQGTTYHVIPHPGDLTHVEGKLTFSPGKVAQVSYDVGAACASFTMTVDVSTNAGSSGTIGIPTFGGTHSVSVNGSVAWNGTSFVAANGIGGANSDSAYVYFTGVQPGVYTLSYTDGTSCGPIPEQWTYCADENGNCAITGTQRVRFGRNGHYDYGIFSADAGAVPCSLATFGGVDPIPNTVKACAFSSELFTSCATEGNTCTFDGTREVRYGANGQWQTLTATGSVSCDATTFGLDPLPDTSKTCEYL